MEAGLTFVYKGGDADGHRIEARQLGRSLIGIDRVVNSSLIVLTSGRSPKQRERFEFYVAAKSPVAGSVEIPTELQNIPWLLPLVHEFIVAHGAEYLRHFLSWVLCSHGGRKAEGIEHMEQMLSMVKEMNRSHEATDDKWIGLTKTLLERLAPAAKDAVAPIGTTARQLVIADQSTGKRTIIDEPMADAIRSKEDLEVGDMQEMTVKVDGIIHHSKQLKVEHPLEPGKFITAEVRDPLFEVLPNPYTEAVRSMSVIRVDAKPVYRHGELYKLYVLNFLGLAETENA